MTNQLRCDNCKKLIVPVEAAVYADNGEHYHMGCDMGEVFSEVGETNERQKKSYKIEDELE